MTAIRVSRALVDALVAGCPVIVVEPGYDLKCPNCGASASMPLEMTCRDHRPVRQPPADLVAAAEATCQACDGDGGIDEPDGYSLIRCQCPDCGGSGRPWVDLVVDCETCDAWEGDPPAAHYACDGRTTAARVQISEVVPIVGANSTPPELKITRVIYGFDPSGAAAIIRPDGGVTMLGVLPDAAPGKWAAIVTAVEAL